MNAVFSSCPISFSARATLVLTWYIVQLAHDQRGGDGAMTNRHRRAQDLGTLMQWSGDGAARHGTTLILMYETGAVAIWIERSEMGHEGSEAHAGELLTRNGVVPGFTRHCARWGPPTSARLSKSHFSRGARWPVVYDWRQLSKRGRAGTPGTGPADVTRPPAGRISGPTPHWIMLMQRQVGNAATAAYVQADVEQPPLAVRLDPMLATAGVTLADPQILDPRILIVVTF